MAASISNIVISNMALAHLGNSHPIDDMYPGDTSAEAYQAYLWYDRSREEMLESFDWNFARARVALSVHADDAPEGQWSYRYTYPSDCIRVLRIENPSGRTADQVAFDIEYSSNEKTILCDIEDAVLVYTKDITNTALFPRKFAIALSFLMASYMAYPITGDIRTKDAMGQIFARSFRSATGSNAQEGREDAPNDADWISGRD